MFRRRDWCDTRRSELRLGSPACCSAVVSFLGTSDGGGLVAAVGGVVLASIPCCPLLKWVRGARGLE